MGKSIIITIFAMFCIAKAEELLSKPRKRRPPLFTKQNPRKIELMQPYLQKMSSLVDAILNEIRNMEDGKVSQI